MVRASNLADGPRGQVFWWIYGDFLLILRVFYEVLWDFIGILGGFYKIFPPPTESDLKEPILLQTYYSDSLPMYIILIFFKGSRTQSTLLPDQFSRNEWVTNFTIKNSCHPGGFSSNGLRSARYASCRCPFPFYLQHWGPSSFSSIDFSNIASKRALIFQPWQNFLRLNLQFFTVFNMFQQVFHQFSIQKSSLPAQSWKPRCTCPVPAPKVRGTSSACRLVTMFSWLTLDLFRIWKGFCEGLHQEKYVVLIELSMWIQNQKLWLNKKIEEQKNAKGCKIVYPQGPQKNGYSRSNRAIH